jgi:benzodiazapine receptor
MNRDILRQFSVIFTTIYALVLNGAANAIPLGGHTTAQVSDSFNALFVPAGYVFSIWGLIYVALLAYTFYHSLPSQRTNPLLRRVGWLVALSSLANGTWILWWQFGYYGLSLVTMLILLGSLLAVYLRLDIGRTAYKRVEKWTVSIPFSIYLGWITVATIANATDVLVNAGWNGFGISPLAWTLIMLGVGVVLGGLMAYTRSDVAYLLVLMWAFAGISVRWLDVPVLNTAGFAAAGLVVLLLAASRLRLARPAATQAAS